MDIRLRALRELRTVANHFATGATTFNDFQKTCGDFLCDIFDSEEAPEVSGAISESYRTEGNFYEQWIRLARESRFRNPHWHYGDPTPNAWIDQAAFREAFRAALNQLVLAPIE